MSSEQRWTQVRSAEGPYYDEEGNLVYKMACLAKYKCSRCLTITRWVLDEEDYRGKCRVCGHLNSDELNELVSKNRAKSITKERKQKTQKEEKKEALSNAAKLELKDIIEKRRNKFKLEQQGGTLATS